MNLSQQFQINSKSKGSPRNGQGRRVNDIGLDDDGAGQRDNYFSKKSAPRDQDDMFGGQGSENDEDENNYDDVLGGIHNICKVGEASKQAEKIIGDQIKKHARDCHLESKELQDLIAFKGKSWPSLEEIYLTRNMINNIDLLGRFQNLRFIYASNNYIEEVVLLLPKLEKLDLSNNYLKKFPLLENGMKKLKYLNLNQNRLVDIREVICEFTPNIKHLDLGGNQIEFDNFNEFYNFLMKIKEWKGITNLIVEDNPFFKPENILKFPNINVIEEFINKLKSLDFFNGDDMITVKKNLKTSQIEHQLRQNNAELGKQYDYNQFDDDTQIDESGTDIAAMTKIEESNRKKRKMQPPKSLASLVYHIESANSHPSLALDYLHDLARDVDEIIEKIHMIENSFAPNLEDNEIDDKIETFMQNTLLLIDNHQELQSIVLSVLAKLSIIKFQNFGLSCFNTLKDLMNAGRDMQLQVQTIIKSDVINKMKQNDPTVIPVSLLIGLCEMIEDTNMTSMLSGMYEMCFPTWLRSFCEKLDEAKKRNIQLENDAHYDAIISLLAASVNENEDNMNKVLDKQMVPYITKIMKSSQWEHDRYIPSLKLIARLANGKIEAANLFVDNYVHTILLGQIKKSLTIYKKYNSLFEDNSPDSIEHQMLKYQTLAAEIKALGGLLQAEEEKRINIIVDPVVLDIIGIMGHSKTDPILLTSICTFALDLFECTELRYNEKFMQPYFNKMANMKYMVHYMGGERYPDLLQMSQRYHNAQNLKNAGNDEDESINPNTDQERQKYDLMKSGPKAKHYIVTSLSNLDDPIVNELFVSIINLMKYFCLEANINKKNNLFDEISDSLNTSNREDALFNCLIIPDDDVRLAVVQCLFVVPLDEFDLEEIGQITKIMSACTNIGAGRTELVLSVIYQICTKLVISDPDEIESSKIFQQKFGHKTVEEALNILKRNLIRVVEQEDEDKEKYSLSLSILNFLKASSNAKLMKPYMQDKSKVKVFRDILQNEEQFSSKRVKTVPIDIENSLIGREINCLIETLSGIETIQPYCDVSLRVLMRMADALMWKNECKYLDINQKGDNFLDALIAFQEKQYKLKKTQELNFWVDLPNNFLDQLPKKSLDELEEQHSSFTMSNGVALIQIYLTSKYPDNEEYVKKLSDKWFDEMDSQGLKKNLEAQIKTKVKELTTKYNKQYDENHYSIRKQFYKKNMMQHKKNEELEKANQDLEKQRVNEADDTEEANMINDSCRKTSMYEFKQEMQFESVGNEYDNLMLNGESLQDKIKIENDLKEKQQEELNKDQFRTMTVKEKRGDGFLNKSIRSLTIAAYLRCLYAAIEYAPTVNLRQNAIMNIKDPQMFRAITQLCDAADWDENAYIGAKYLRVMRHAIKLPYQQVTESTKMIMHYELLAIVIQKCLKKIIDKMKKDIALRPGDTVTAFEITLTFFQVVRQANNFNFSDLDLVKTYQRHEIEIENDLQNAHNKSLQKQKDQINSGSTPQPLQKPAVSQSDIIKKIANKLDEVDHICKYKVLEDPDRQEDPKTFYVDRIAMTCKRKPQEKAVEFMVLKLFTKQTIFNLVDILFRDMADDYKLIQNNDESSSDHDDPDHSEHSQQNVKAENSGGDDSDSQEEDNKIIETYGIDIQDYISTKGVLNIERIKDIMGEIMNSCQKKMRYDILQTFMKGVIYDQKKLRESFMQEILNAADSATYRLALEKYVIDNDLGSLDHDEYRTKDGTPGQAKGGHKAEKPEKIRISFYAHVDLINKDLKDKNQNFDFIKRLFVVTNQGLLILKNIPKEYQCLDSPPQMFCPRGPSQEILIKYKEIQSIISVPQMPQKLVILYCRQAEDPQSEHKDFQLTLNIPHFTKASKIFQDIRGILQVIDHKKKMEKLKSKKENQKCGSIGDKLKIINQDLFVQQDLRYVIQQISPRSKKKKINKIQVIFASLQHCKGKRMVISERHFKTHIATKEIKNSNQFGKPDPVAPQTPAKQQSSYFNFMVKNAKAATEEKNVFNNKVIVCIIDKMIICLTEKWDKWSFIPQNKPDILKSILKKLKKSANEDKQDDGDTPQKDADTSSVTPGFMAFGSGIEAKTPMIGADADKFQKEVESCGLKQKVKSSLFNAVIKLQADQVKNMKIHRGKDASVELLCGASDMDLSQEEPYRLKIMFTGDMERQKFVECMMGEREDGDGSDEDSVKDDKSNESWAEEEKSESDEEIMKAVMYD